MVGRGGESILAQTSLNLSVHQNHLGSLKNAGAWSSPPDQLSQFLRVETGICILTAPGDSDAQRGLKTPSVHEGDLQNKGAACASNCLGAESCRLEDSGPLVSAILGFRETYTKAMTEARAVQRARARQLYHCPLRRALLPFASYPGNLARFCIFGTVIV